MSAPFGDGIPVISAVSQPLCGLNCSLVFLWFIGIRTRVQYVALTAICYFSKPLNWFVGELIVMCLFMLILRLFVTQKVGINQLMNFISICSSCTLIMLPFIRIHICHFIQGYRTSSWRINVLEIWHFWEKHRMFVNDLLRLIGER